MSRLIEADKLIELLEAARAPYTAPILNGVIKVINAMPTAYDVDKVVDELDEAKFYYDGYVINHIEAIDIVKRGGIE